MPETKEVKTPIVTDPEWSDWVLSQLVADELIDGAPKTDGLRRLVEKYIGDIVSMNSNVVQAPCNGNENRAVVSVQIGIRKEGDVHYFSGSADACTRNSDPPYNMFPTAIAETRAYGRAFRNALRIRNAVAEELSNNAEYAAETAETHVKISGPQIKGIDNLCKLLDISVESFVNAGEIKYKNIREVSLNKATLMMKTLNSYQNKERENVPDTFKGYVKDWRDTFLGDK